MSDILGSVRRHWRTSVVMILLTMGVLAVFLVTRSEVRGADRFRVELDLLVPAASEDGVLPEGVPPELLRGQSRRALAESTTDRALELAEVDPADRRGISFSFSQNETKDIITLTVVTNDPFLSTSVAEAYAQAYVETRRQTVEDAASSAKNSARNSVAQLSARLVEVEDELRAKNPALLEVLGNVPSGDAEEGGGPNISVSPSSIDESLLVFERDQLLRSIRDKMNEFASASVDSVVPKGFAQTVDVRPPAQITPDLASPLMPALMILAFGLALAVAVPVLQDRLDTTIRDRDTAAAVFEAPVLSEIPAVARTEELTLAKPGSPRDGAFRTLAATSIATERLPRAIVVTSPTGEAQDAVAANFAAALGAHGLRVALVATHARQAWFLEAGGAPEPGESTLSLPDMLELAEQGRLDGAVERGLVPTRLENLVVLPPGPSDLQVNLDGLPPLLEALSCSDVDVTVIAGPALLEDPSATIFAWLTRSVLWVFESGEISQAEAKLAASRLALARASAFGVVMVDSIV